MLEHCVPICFPVGARNLNITPLKDRYHLDDILICSAIGNPSPLYRWKSLQERETQETIIAVGPQLALNKIRVDVDQQYTFECIAQNHVDGETKLSSATVDVIIQG